MGNDPGQPVKRSDIHVRAGLEPGDLGRVVSLHGELYAEEDAEFGPKFEAFVAGTLCDFVVQNDARGQVWLAYHGDRLIGSSALVERDGETGLRGQLRWIAVRKTYRGLGLGRELVQLTLDHARDIGCSEVFLETTQGLDASKVLYERLGFETTAVTDEPLWTDHTTVIHMRLKFSA